MGAPGIDDLWSILVDVEALACGCWLGANGFCSNWSMQNFASLRLMVRWVRSKRIASIWCPWRKASMTSGGTLFVVGFIVVLSGSLK